MSTAVRLLVADDESAPREQLLQALQQAWPEARVVAQADNGAEAWDAWLEHEPDVAFLDIRMPGLTGIDVAQRIAGRSDVVFVTAYGDHALAAFDAGAIDYLVKPVDLQRLAQTVARLRDRRSRRRPEDGGAVAAAPDPQAEAMARLLTQLASQAHRPALPSTLQASVGKEVRLIRLDEVVYFEADARYTRVVYHRDGSDADALLRTPLKVLLTQLDPSQFTQVHRSVIVAERHILAAVRSDEGNMHLRLRGRPETLPVSRPFQGLFKGQ